MRFGYQFGSLPRPVLRPAGDKSSYANSDFSFELTNDITSSPSKLVLEFEIDHPDIVALVKDGKAKVSLATHCEATYFYELNDVAFTNKQDFAFDERRVFGKVYFSLVVLVRKRVSGFSPSRLEPAFAGMSFDLNVGDVIAVSDEKEELYVLPPMSIGDSVFELILVPELGDDHFNVDLSEQKIRIGVGEKLNELVQYNMGTADGRRKNICSVYLPALVDVLYHVRDESFDGKAWYEAIRLAMSSIGVEIHAKKDWTPLEIGQRLLRTPYMALLERTG